MLKYKTSALLINLFLIVFLFLLNGCSKNNFPTSILNDSKVDTSYTYTNPVGNITNIGDPYVLQYEGKYFMYATASSKWCEISAY